MAKSYVMVDLDDPRTAGIAEVMSNKTCKHILSLLSEESLSESELSAKMKAPLNTVNYNVRKLVKVGLIEPNRSFWSIKGRQVKTYKISNKKIVISPKTNFKGVVPAILATGLFAWLVRTWTITQQQISSNSGIVAQKSAEFAQSGANSASNAIQTATSLTGNASDLVNGTVFGNVTNSTASGISDYIYTFLSNAPNSWAWFFIGSMAALVFIVLWNWFRS